VKLVWKNISRRSWRGDG